VVAGFKVKVEVVVVVVVVVVVDVGEWCDEERTGLIYWSERAVVGVSSA
jgi:hypothetical protein